VEQDWQDSASTDEYGLLEVRKSSGYPVTSVVNLGLTIVVIPSLAFRKKIFDFLFVHVLVDACRSRNFRGNKDAISKHELSKNVPESLILRELVPHCAHQRFSSVSGLFDSRVDVVDQVISHVNCTSDCLTDTASLHPRLSIMKGEWEHHILRVSSHEWIPLTKLVEHNE